MSCQSTRVKTVSLILVSIMLWQCGGLCVYAQARSIQSQKQAEAFRRAPLTAFPESHFDALLGELKDVVKHGAEKTKAAPENGFTAIDKLAELKGKLIAENEKNQKSFGQLEISLKQKGLPAEILEREAQSVREYETKYAVLMARLEGIESAQDQTTGLWSKLTGKNKEVNWDGVLGETLNFLEKNTPRPVTRRLDPKNLPHSSLKTDKPIPPKLTREDWLKAFPKDSASSARASAPRTALFATTTPTPADSAETIEVKFTQEIRQLADSLGKNPVRIFNWVRNNIEFVPTWGSIQGAQLCFENRAGNAFDSASLLIALLRYSGVPARYQMGTIEVPVDKFKNWAGGFTNIDAAASFFAGAGVPSVVRRVNQGGQVVSVKLEHVWVRAFVDHAPSGGAVNAQGDAWIDLDPSFKQYDYPAPVNLSQFVNISNAQAFLNQVLATATVNQQTGEVTSPDLAFVQSTFQPDQAAVANYVKANFPLKSVRELIGVGKVIPRDLSVLAAGLPYRMLIAGAGFAEVPPALRHRLELTVADPFGNQTMTFTRSLPELVGGRITFGYAPAGEADRQALAALLPTDPQQPLASLPAFTNLVPEVRINDQVAATGGAVRLGAAQVMALRFTAPTIQTPAVVNEISAGEFFAIALDLQQISNNSLTGLTSRLTQIANEVGANPTSPNVHLRELEDLLLNAVALGWFKQVDFVNQVSAQLSGVASLRYPSAALAFSDLVPSSLFGAVHRVTFGGITMDVDRDVIVAVAKDGRTPRTVNYGLVTGAIGSMLEGSVPTQMMRGLRVADRYSLATTSALGVATTRGGTLLALTENNFPLVSARLGVPADDVQDFQDALNAGMLVMVHERQLVDVNGSRYLGYIKFDPETGSGGYILGGAGGSREVFRCGRNRPPGASDVLLNNTLASFFTDVRNNAVEEVISRVGVGGVVGNILTLLNLIKGYSENLERFNNATGAAPDQRLQPLMGLVVLLTALDVLKELVTQVVDVPGLGHLVTAYLNVVGWIAWRMAELFITHFLVIDAAIEGIEIPPDCILDLEPPPED